MSCRRMKKYTNVSLRPCDFFMVLRKLGSEVSTYPKLVLWARKQGENGNAVYESFMAKQGADMPPLCKSWQLLLKNDWFDSRDRQLHLW